ncbi:MAG: hypothetical protein VSS75_027845, partial [Candidatus Parabeggiatoa sp.]|nr:hypothetical protein [Candidatus Parabeggiatoa sp.]
MLEADRRWGAFYAIRNVADNKQETQETKRFLFASFASFASFAFISFSIAKAKPATFDITSMKRRIADRRTASETRGIASLRCYALSAKLFNKVCWAEMAGA